MYYVYVLECRDGSLYAGMTNDLRRRMTLHAAGRGATENGLPGWSAAGGRCPPRPVSRPTPGYVYEPVRDVTLEGILNG